MKTYRNLTLYRKVQIFAVAFLLLNQVGGFLLATVLGASIQEILIGLGIEMVGAVFTAMGVAYLDKSFTMAFDNKYGDPLQAELQNIKRMLTQLTGQMAVLNEAQTHAANADQYASLEHQLDHLAKQNQQLTAIVQHISHRTE